MDDQKPRMGMECPDCGHQTEGNLRYCPRCEATMFRIVFEYPAESPKNVRR